MKPDWKTVATLCAGICAAGGFAASATAAALELEKNPFDLRRITLRENTLAPHSRMDLQHFTLVQLRMVGTLGNRQRLVALLADPNQHIYLISVGSRIGPDQGIVTRINNRGIELQETWRSAPGQIQTRTTRLEMDPR